MRHLLAALLLLTFLSAAAQVSPAALDNKSELIPSASRVAAPDFNLTAVDGRPLSLSKLRGKVVLLDFWATTCGGCKIELPWYVEFDHRYRAEGLSLIGLDMYGESPELIKPFLIKWKMDYPVAVGTDAIGDQFKLREMPLTVLIDRKGRIAVSHTGIVDKASFEADIQKLLRE